MAEQNRTRVTICIEAKADEPFGGAVWEELQKARQRRGTRFPEQLDWLTHSLFGISAFSDDNQLVLCQAVSHLPYQLLSAIAGTLLEAQLQKAVKAIFLVHEFRTAATLDAKLEANANSLQDFVRFMYLQAVDACDEPPRMEFGQMAGPICILRPASPGAVKLPREIPLFIGKIRTDRTIE